MSGAVGATDRDGGTGPSAVSGRPVRVRFAPSPTGSLHIGNALTAVANRRFADEHGGTLVLRIDDTDAARGVAGGEAAILGDLAWLGVRVDEGPVRQSERAALHRAAAERLLAAGAAVRDPADGSLRVAPGVGGVSASHRPTLLRADGSPTYHLASVADDADLRISHVIRGADHRPSAELHLALIAALGAPPPEVLHHGLVLGPDGGKLSKRDAAGEDGIVSLADARAAGLPPEAVRAYLEELGLPRHDVKLDLARVHRLSVEALAALPDEQLAARVGVPPALAPALRGARDLVEARDHAEAILHPWGSDAYALPPRAPHDDLPTLVRFVELCGPLGGLDEAAARSVVRELKAVGGDLKALRRALTGRERGPELWAVLLVLGRDEAIARVAGALPE